MSWETIDVEILQILKRRYVQLGNHRRTNRGEKNKNYVARTVLFRLEGRNAAEILKRRSCVEMDGRFLIERSAYASNASTRDDSKRISRREPVCPRRALAAAAATDCSTRIENTVTNYLYYVSKLVHGTLRHNRRRHVSDAASGHTRNENKRRLRHSVREDAAGRSRRGAGRVELRCYRELRARCTPRCRSRSSWSTNGGDVRARPTLVVINAKLAILRPRSAAHERVHFAVSRALAARRPRARPNPMRRSGAPLAAQDKKPRVSPLGSEARRTGDRTKIPNLINI